MSSPQVTPNPATSVVETSIVSPQEFAQKIKDKYPAYGAMKDGELVQKVLQKYPQYGNQIKGYAQKRTGDHQGALVLTGQQEQDLGMRQPDQPSRTDKVASFITRQDPTIGAAIGSVAGGMAGGIPGAVAGATAGGAAGSALQQKVSRGAVSGKEAAKEGAVQGAWDLVGGLAGKGISKAAELLGVSEAVMKFALKTGEDLDRGVNPAAAMNKFKIRAALTKDLYEKTGTQIGSLSKVADGIMDTALPYSSTVRPYAVIKGVLSKYDKQAVETADPEIRDAMQKMVENVSREFNNVQTGAAGVARQEAQQAGKAIAPAAKGLPTDRVMTIKEANALKRSWGDTVNWSKAPVQDKMQAVFTAEMAARRDIYNALNQQIADSMGGNEGKLWLSKNRDIQNLMEAKSLIKSSAEGLQSSGKNILESLTDMARKPGIGSRVAQGAEIGTDIAQKMGSNLPQLGRGALIGADALAGNSNVPMPQK